MRATRLNRFVLLAAVLGLALIAVTRLEAQRRAFSNTRIAAADDFDGAFQFCRVAFQNGIDGDPNSGDWQVDFPRADINLSIRLGELTRTVISKNDLGLPNNVIIRLTSPELFQCPFIMMTEVGAADLSTAEITRLREYLLKGGFLWADDFWGTEAWDWWESQLALILPPEDYPVVKLTPEHPIYRAQFFLTETPQIANIGHWARYGDGMERGSDSPHADTRAIMDRHGNIMALMTHDTDFGDSFEREADDPTYFLENSVPGYQFGINALLYAMAH